MKRILVTDGQQRKALSVCRSLGQRGMEIYIAETTRATPAGFSKYCKKRLVCPDPQQRPAEYLEWLLKVIDGNQIDMLIATDEGSIGIICGAKELVASRVKILMPDESSLLKAIHKGNSTSVAMEAGVPCPKTVFPEEEDEAELWIEELGLPVVIKPCRSNGSRGIRVARDLEELKREGRLIRQEYGEFILQQYIPQGLRYDVCLIYDKDGTLAAEFVQKELRHFPEPMGPSTVQESVHFPMLLDRAKSMMELIPWQGVVELEFMEDPGTGELLFMEINGKLWASLELAVICGVDFPWLMVALLEEGNEGAGSSDFRYPDYEDGVLCRWLLPGDLFRMLTVGPFNKWDPPFVPGRKRRIHDDIVRGDDPWPVVGFILACFRYLFSIKTWKSIFWR